VLVADPEVVRDLVQHDAPDHPPEQLRLLVVSPLERPAVARDLVGQSRVRARPGGQRHALVEAEQRLRWT
jgi:hypothetical protein